MIQYKLKTLYDSRRSNDFKFGFDLLDHIYVSQINRSQYPSDLVLANLVNRGAKIILYVFNE